MLSWPSSHSASAAIQIARCHGLEDLGIEAMLLLQDSGGQGCLGVVVLDSDGCLRNDRTVVHFLVDEVNGDARDLVAMLQGLPLCMEALEGRQ